MEASWARAELAEKRHMEKLKAKEAKRQEQQAQKPQPEQKQRHVKKISSTAERRREHMRKAQPGEEPEQEEEAQLNVRKDNGTTVVYAAAVQDIQAFLQDHGSDATLEEVRRGVGIDLLQPGLLQALRTNELIETVALPTGEQLRYRPPYGVRNRGSLAHLLANACPGGNGDTEAVLRSELNADETYAGLDVDIDELLAQGRCARVQTSDKRSRDFVLMAMPPGRAATEEVRELWKQVERVPQGQALQDELVRRGLRTAEQMSARKARKAEARKRAQELEAQPKKQRTGQIRTWRNTHLGNAEQLEGMFQR